MAVSQDQDQDIMSSDDDAVPQPRVALLKNEASQEGEKEDDYYEEEDEVDDQVEDQDEDEDDSEDETVALMRELEKIKQERALEKERLDREQKQREIAFSNPLLNDGSSLTISDSFVVKRRWDDDTMFKNQAQRGANDDPKSFINDTLRSDFHRKFLNKYIR
ncbi:hypothetical protein NADFUDRAFT_82602 [Nadsonia fulvescens var. elongata DSM 6958]|uniref:Pre-mRNA-splicing factor CWC15 n=1 Tax=Nadsonia fulvescens var. elongata DSM 6958 TaxID=857566 RepID=A0A1E3PJT6_9ASCO|nr:hypothetical protein NADFUDRAFT_82602 [Nadsonia fulvescens var. elongata DSM 6958]